jgi:hypothetical protein
MVFLLVPEDARWALLRLAISLQFPAGSEILLHADHCHLERNHQGLENELIEERSDELDMNAAIECRVRMGGVLKYYDRRAA